MIILISFASLATIFFGIWHFFLPTQWNWYSYIVPGATELVVAVQAMNVLFSLCLILIGTADLLLILVGSDRFARIVMLSLSSILWTVRVMMQIIAPQGSALPFLQYGMLSGFLIIWVCFAMGLWIEIKHNTAAYVTQTTEEGTHD